MVHSHRAGLCWSLSIRPRYLSCLIEKWRSTKSIMNFFDASSLEGVPEILFRSVNMTNEGWVRASFDFTTVIVLQGSLVFFGFEFSVGIVIGTATPIFVQALSCPSRKTRIVSITSKYPVKFQQFLSCLDELTYLRDSFRTFNMKDWHASMPDHLCGSVGLWVSLAVSSCISRSDFEFVCTCIGTWLTSTSLRLIS